MSARSAAKKINVRKIFFFFVPRALSLQCTVPKNGLIVFFSTTDHPVMKEMRENAFEAWLAARFFNFFGECADDQPAGKMKKKTPNWPRTRSYPVFFFPPHVATSTSVAHVEICVSTSARCPSRPVPPFFFFEKKKVKKKISNSRVRAARRLTLLYNCPSPSGLCLPVDTPSRLFGCLNTGTEEKMCCRCGQQTAAGKQRNNTRNTVSFVCVYLTAKENQQVNSELSPTLSSAMLPPRPVEIPAATTARGVKR
jgi:hypothetical protein